MIDSDHHDMFSGSQSDPVRMSYPAPPSRQMRSLLAPKSEDASSRDAKLKASKGEVYKDF